MSIAKIDSNNNVTQTKLPITTTAAPSLNKTTRLVSTAKIDSNNIVTKTKLPITTTAKPAKTDAQSTTTQLTPVTKLNVAVSTKSNVAKNSARVLIQTFKPSVSTRLSTTVKKH